MDYVAAVLTNACLRNHESNIIWPGTIFRLLFFFACMSYYYYDYYSFIGTVLINVIPRTLFVCGLMYR
jgi:hypothetical protein